MKIKVKNVNEKFYFNEKMHHIKVTPENYHLERLSPSKELVIKKIRDLYVC